jgi:threonylcarbamoyladenosine tRNA methylthiotransferase MtaB
MVGFPGETAAEFEETRRLIEDLPLTYLHVFTYSARPGTPAADMRHQVPVQVARERNRVLHELGEEKKLEFMRTFVGKTVEAITLAGPDKGALGASGRDARQDQFTEALTDNYLKLQVQGKHAPNLWIHTRVNDVKNSTLVATSLS